MKYSYFLDKNNNRNRNAIIDGAHFNKSLSGVYFELYISLDGNLNIEIEQDRYFFYKSKLGKIYNGLEKLCDELSNKRTYLFYNEVTFKNCRLVKSVKSKVYK